MTDDGRDDMSWFHQQLTADEQVDLLRHPHKQLPAELAERLPGVMEWWFADPEGTKFLAPQASNKLDDYRAQLDYWWSCLSDADKQYFIAHRDDELPGEYAQTVMGAGGAHHTGAPVLAIAIVQDTGTGGFRLPAMVRVYVELKAREVA